MSKSGVGRRFNPQNTTLASHRFTPQFDQAITNKTVYSHSPDESLPAQIIAYLKDNKHLYPSIVVNGVIHDAYVDFIRLFVYRIENDKLPFVSPEIEATYKPLIDQARNQLLNELQNSLPTHKAHMILRHLRLGVSEDQFREIYRYTLKKMYQEEMLKLQGTGVNEQTVSIVKEAYAACTAKTRAKL